MQSESLQSPRRPLRILYALNGSPQYILARSPGPVPVELIPTPAASTASSSRSPAPRYATASLKTCLNAICRSSPEIIQDRTRDFSVYLLDPLETDCAPAQVKISHSLSQSPLPDAPEARVAVGLGLMSWGLMADESETSPVTGTLMIAGTGQEMLEIIFSLRETVPMDKASLPENLGSWGLPDASTTDMRSSQTMSSKRKGKKPTRYPPSGNPNAKATPPPVTASDQLLDGHIYIGPERPRRGRPKQSRVQDDDEVVVVDGPGTSNPPPEKNALLDLLAFLKVVTPDAERNQALGNVLGLVHGQDGTAERPSPELVGAMNILSEYQRPSDSQSAPQFSRSQSQPEGAALFNQHRRKSSSAEEEIVVLNKENVNPKNFRRRAERDKEDANLSSSGEPAAPAANLSTGWARSQSQPEGSRLLTSNQAAGRKRTLNEFMEGQEKEKAQKRAQYYYRQPERSLSDFPSASGSTTTGTSRPRSLSVTSSPGPDAKNNTAPVPQSKPIISASSPIRPPRKKYVVPAWARTDTATQPRLSDRVILQQEQEMENKRKAEEDKKKREAKRRPNEAKERLKEGKRRKAGPSTTTTKEQASNPSETSTFSLPAPVAASGEFPALSGLIVGASRSLSPAPLSNPSPPTIPCTPPRKRANTVATPGVANSLFTPASASWEASRARGLGRHSMSPSTRKERKQDGEQVQPSEQPISDDEDLLGQELDSAFNEFDFPPSTLPAPSGDNAIEEEEEDEDGSDEEVEIPRKEHWIGLPPSSPPPPSSPYLMPEASMDEEVEESPLATSEADVVSELAPVASLSSPPINCSVEELGEFLKSGDWSSLFSAPSSDPIDAASLLDQFTNQNLELPSDDSILTMKDWGLDAANPDLDFTEFWESIKPLVEGTTETGGTSEGEALAENVHALYSGCLV